MGLDEVTYRELRAGAVPHRPVEKLRRSLTYLGVRFHLDDHHALDVDKQPRTVTNLHLRMLPARAARPRPDPKEAQWSP